MPATAVSSAQTAAKELKRLSNLVQEASSNSVLYSAESTPEQILEFLDSKTEGYGLVGANYYDTDGNLLESRENESASEFFKKAVNGETYISSPYVDKASNELVFMVATPVWRNGTKGGSVIGVTNFIIKQRVMNELVESVKVSENAIAYMVDSEGYTIADLDVQLVIDKENIPQAAQSDASLQELGAVYEKAIAGESGFGSYEYNGVKKFAAYAPIEGSDGWSFLIAAPEKDFTGGFTTAIYSAVAIIIFSVIIGFFIATVMTKSLEVALGGVMKRLSAFAEGDIFSPMPDVPANSYESVNLKNYTKLATENTSAVVHDIDYILSEMASGNFDLVSQCAEKYVGDYESILTSVGQLKEAINTSFHSIADVSAQVSAGASQVNMGSQTLAQGATEQASSVQELSASMTEISQRVRQNAEDAEKANKLTAETEAIMQGSVNDMELARQAMDEISSTSNNISKVIKTIDDIAFQTNILALNAAVEAARAGAAGKGFAVVADEVRNLSQKSAEAAKNTTALIESSIEAVEKGTQLVEKTSGGFAEVATKSSEIAKIVEDISTQAQEQSTAISQVATGIEQVSSVVQMNSATAEESAAASEELSSQSMVLKDLVSQFKLAQG